MSQATTSQSVHCRKPKSGCPDDLDYGCVCRCVGCTVLNDQADEDLTVEERMGTDGWRRDRDHLWYHVRDVHLQYTFDAARSKWMEERA